MIDYRTPLPDIVFTLEQVAEAGRLPSWDSQLTAELLAHSGRFVDEVIAPLDAVGDRDGVRLVDGRVRLPAAFHEAFAAFREGGWQGMATDVRYGGQGLPALLASVFSETMAGACLSFHMAVSLTQGVMRTLAVNADERMKDLWIPRLASCEWLASMCLTEPQAGSDLSRTRTTASPRGASWSIDGGKIFISGGDQDFNGRVLHLVLARTRDAEPGVKGLSLFLAPSELEDGRRNGVAVVRVEEKMGLHAAATCQLAFDGALAEMLGKPGEGLKRMFTLMNAQRLEVALQGVGLADCAAQRSLAYAQSRVQGRGANSPEAVAIIEHDDVKRMVMTQMALTLGGRAMCYRSLTDIEVHGATPLADLMTSVCKVFCSEAAVTSAHLGIQVHGGYGLLKEYRVEQVLRDARVTQIYEGTNGIHAATLAGRLLRDGRCVEAFRADVIGAIDRARRSGCSDATVVLADLLDDWLRASDAVAAAAHPGALADPYMRLTGLVAFGAAWVRLEAAAERAANPVRIHTLARFVWTFMLPEAKHHARMCLAPLRLDDMPATAFLS